MKPSGSGAGRFFLAQSSERRVACCPALLSALLRGENKRESRRDHSAMRAAGRRD